MKSSHLKNFKAIHMREIFKYRTRTITISKHKCGERQNMFLIMSKSVIRCTKDIYVSKTCKNILGPTPCPITLKKVHSLLIRTML